MKAEDLRHSNFSDILEKHYSGRASDFSKRFLKWFLENIFRLDEFMADDACVDAKHDKGVDAIYVDNISEIVYVIQAKTKTSDKATLGDTELKDFYGTLVQFSSQEKIESLAEETKNGRLKQAIIRNEVSEKVAAGYDVQGVFITNVPANDDAHGYIKKAEIIDLYDSAEIASDYVDLNVDGGISEKFKFDVSDSEVIEYDAGRAFARIFLAPALNLTKMEGISDGVLFEQNVRLSLGNTKVNKSIKSSIREQSEHGNFPLYHNGINVLCREIIEENDQFITVEDYVVVNGAQSLTSLLSERAKITDDLKILVKLIEVKGDVSLSQKITRNSNNQNAIKARDMKSNHNLQQRLKAEIEKISGGKIAYEIKQGENNKGKEVISNEAAGLVLLAADLEQPWSCHQKYKIMDDLHSEIFGRPSVTGAKVLALWKCFQVMPESLRELENKPFANYTLTKFFLFFAVIAIIKDSAKGLDVLSSLDRIAKEDRLDKLVNGFSILADNAAIDLNAEVAPEDDEYFDYKNDLKSQKWCKAMSAKLLAQHKKDVKRDKAESVAEAFGDLFE
ncbi:AIPR family protein [Halomonas sp. GD1P12]|uniref:AIPR family protein n=1 Tax=Halomonas sp. GD1P12 TaxID=2982691 RepID=UPI0021E45201|nr:AIPR family protein [Halomonas sp. GD1P12]UYF98973.1 AIPR family protein [Halomonas sp. GD1P12]